MLVLGAGLSLADSPVLEGLVNGVLTVELDYLSLSLSFSACKTSTLGKSLPLPGPQSSFKENKQSCLTWGKT